MKFVRIFFIATILIGATRGGPCLNLLNKDLCKSSLLLITTPSLPSLLSIKNLDFGTPCGRPPHLCTCGKHLTRPQPLPPQIQPRKSLLSLLGHDIGDLKRLPLCTCGWGLGGPQLEEKDINIKLRITVPKGCSLHPY